MPKIVIKNSSTESCPIGGSGNMYTIGFDGDEVAKLTSATVARHQISDENDHRTIEMDNMNFKSGTAIGEIGTVIHTKNSRSQDGNSQNQNLVNDATKPKETFPVGTPESDDKAYTFGAKHPKDISKTVL